MQMDSDPRLDRWFRGQGGELEKALREAGTPLPQDVSGEAFVRALLEEAEKRVRSPEGQARAKKAAGIIKQVAAELPGGHVNPAFLKRIKARLRELYGPDGGGTSASA